MSWIVTVALILSMNSVAHAVPCDWPVDYVGTYWSGYTADTLAIKQFVTFNSGDVTIDDGVNTVAYTCAEAGLDPEPFFYLIISSPANDLSCIQVAKGGSVVLYRQKSVAAGLTTAQCDDEFDETIDVSVIIEYTADAFVIEGGGCPTVFSDGTFTVTYLTETGGTVQCEGDASSNAIGGDTSVNLATCFTGQNTYYQPFDWTLNCVHEFDAVLVGGEDSGHVLILYVQPNSNDNQLVFYCARYDVDFGNFTVFMSLAALDITESKCSPTAMFDDATLVATPNALSGYKALTFTASDCASGPCENAATCEQSLPGFNCVCAPGYTGTLCADGIDDCLGDPCGPGECADGANTYTCTCPETFTGTNCETPVCVYDDAVEGQWYAGADLTVGADPYFQQLTFETTGILTAIDLEVYQCKESVTDGDITYIQLVQEVDYGVSYCMQHAIYGKVMLYRLTGVQASVSSATDCQDLLKPSVDPLHIAYAFDGSSVEMAPSVACPFTAGTWQLTMHESGAANQCSDDKGSHAISDDPGVATGTLDFNSCVDTDTFAQPFESKLKCVQAISAAAVDGTEGGDNVVIIAYPEAASNENFFYCARYREPADDIIILLSFHITSDVNYLTWCAPVQDAELVDVDNTAFVLTSNICVREDPCENESTCTDLKQDYECACVEGYEGKDCETNIDDCLSVPCNGHGACTDLVNDFLCVCAVDYDGDTCDDFNDCFSNPCLGSAQCSNTASGYQCQCSPGTQPPDCEDINECDSNPCLNGGLCEDGDNEYTCNCPAGTMGDTCIDIDECLSNPCMNSGTCINSIDGWYCDCTPFWLWAKCEHYNECGSNPCQNGGECEDRLYYYECACSPGFQGNNCQEETNDACGGNPCGSFGACSVDGNSYLCVCVTGWTGQNCDVSTTDADGDDEGLDSLSQVLIALFVVFVLFACVLAVGLYCSNTCSPK